MSLIEKVTAPLRIVENEFEALVHSLYSLYNRKTGRDQYALANSYATGGVLYLSTAVFLESGLSIVSVLSSGGWGYGLYYVHRNNKVARSLDEELFKSSETIKNLRRERWRNEMRNVGRLGLILGANSLVYQTFGYSIFDLLGSEQSRPPIENMFTAFSMLLYSLSGYTSAIDINNPKKSKIAAKAREWLSSKRKIPENKIGIPDGLPQENLLSIPPP